MTDDEIVERIRIEGRRGSATDVARVLDTLVRGGVTQGSLVTYFKRAFPDIPLQRLLDAGGWHRVSSGGLTDDQFRDHLQPWIPTERDP